MNKEDPVQAVILVDNFNSNFHPIVDDTSLGLFPVVGVPLIDFILESLAQGGVDEAILFCCNGGSSLKDYISKCVASQAAWSLSMETQVLMSDSCRSMGDVLREIDAAGLVRSYFILAGVSTIANVHFATLLDQHKQICKRDKGAAMTIVYKKVCSGHPLINRNEALFLATDGPTKRILMHKKCKSGMDKSLSLPLEIMLNHSQVDLHHNLVDTNIALCSPSVLPLFSDNFDFQTKDDFVNGVLINEEILASTLYYLPLRGKDYAASVTNWSNYKVISRDIMHHWAHPLTVETGAFKGKGKYTFTGLHNYRNKSATLSRTCEIIEDVLIGENTFVDDNTVITKSVLGANCKIGKNNNISGGHIQSDVIIKDGCHISDSYIGANTAIEDNVTIKEGSLIAPNSKIESGAVLSGAVVARTSLKKEISQSKSQSESADWDNESASDDDDGCVGFNKVYSDSDSYRSSGSSEDLTMPDSPAPDDTNIFLQEVIDSLARGYEEKLKCDYLILEINSSRYAYNIQLNEVNFFVVRALLSLPMIAEAKNVLVTVKDVLKYFMPILNNYIKSKTSINDCLKAIEDSCLKNEWLAGKAGQVVHLLYDADVIDEDSLNDWFNDLKENESEIASQPSLVKFFEWLQQASEESDESD